MKSIDWKNSKQPHNFQELQKLQHVIERSGNDYKKILHAMNTINQKLNIIINNVSEFIYMLDTDGNICFISDDIRRYGFSAKELSGSSILDMVHPTDKTKATYRINERRQGLRKTTACEIRMMTYEQLRKKLDGKVIIVENTPLFAVSAEGYYHKTDEKISFMGTIGIAREIQMLQDFDSDLLEQLHNGSGSLADEKQQEDSFIPICANCKKIRDSHGNWENIESFIGKQLHTQFTHSICPECTIKLYPDIDD